MNRFMREFIQTTGELLESDQVRMMGRWKHHGPISTLDPVSYTHLEGRRRCSGGR